MQNPTQTRRNQHLTPAQHNHTLHKTLPPVPDNSSVRIHIHTEFIRRALPPWCLAARGLWDRAYTGPLAAGATGATLVLPLHSSPLIHAQARTCSGRLLSQLWTGPSRHRARLPTLPTHTTQNHTRHTFTGAPPDPPSQCEQLFAWLRDSPEAHINTHALGWVGQKSGAVKTWAVKHQLIKAYSVTILWWLGNITNFWMWP